MPNSRPKVLTIAGFDPSGGAGLLADVKTFEALQVYGLGVCSAITVQTEVTFRACEWTDVELLLDQISVLREQYEISWAKIGLIQDVFVLETVLDELNGINVIWDPIMTTSSGFELHSDWNIPDAVYEKLYLITPNTDEVSAFLPGLRPMEAAKAMSHSCQLLLKGGHEEGPFVVDRLIREGEVKEFSAERIEENAKHGSGCVYSAALTAYLAGGRELTEACQSAKEYVEQFIQSTSSLLGEHTVV